MLELLHILIPFRVTNLKNLQSDQTKPDVGMPSAVIWLVSFSPYLLPPRWACWWSVDTKRVSQHSFEVSAASLFELSWWICMESQGKPLTGKAGHRLRKTQILRSTVTPLHTQPSKKAYHTQKKRSSYSKGTKEQDPSLSCYLILYT